jgi:hypothetical protein
MVDNHHVVRLLVHRPYIPLKAIGRWQTGAPKRGVSAGWACAGGQTSRQAGSSAASPRAPSPVCALQVYEYC